MADFNSVTDFENLDTYVPTFYLKPFRAGHQDVINSSANPLDDNNIAIVGDCPSFLKWYIRPAQNLTRRPNYDELVDKLVINHGWNIQDFDILKDRAELLMTKNRQVFDKHQEVSPNTFTTSKKPGVSLFSNKESKPLSGDTIFKSKEADRKNYLEGDNGLFTGFDDYLLESQAVHKSDLYNQDIVWRDGVFYDQKKQVVSESLSENVRVRRFEKNVKEEDNDKSCKVHKVDQQRKYTFTNHIVAKRGKVFNIKTSQNLSHPTPDKVIENVQENSVSDVNIHYNNCKSNDTQKIKFVSPQPLKKDFSIHSEKLKLFKEFKFNNKTFRKNVVSQNGDPIKKTLKIALNDTDLNFKELTTLKKTSLGRQEGYSSTFVQHMQNSDPSVVSDTKENIGDTIGLYSLNHQSLKSKISEVMGTKEQGPEVHHSSLFTDTIVEKHNPTGTEGYSTSSNFQERNKECKTINIANDRRKLLNKNSLIFIQVLEIMKILRSPKLLTSNKISNYHNAVSHSQIENYLTSRIKNYNPIIKVKTTKNYETLKLQKMFFNYIKQAFYELDNDQKRSKTEPEVISRDSSQHTLEMNEVKAGSEENNNINELFEEDQIEQTDFNPSNNDAITVEDSLDSTYEELSEQITTSLNTSNNETGEKHLIDSLSLDYNVYVDVQDTILERWALKYNLYPEITKYFNQSSPVNYNEFQKANNSQRSLKFSGVPQIRNTNFSNSKTQIKLPVKHRVGYVSRKSYSLNNAYAPRLKLNQRVKRVREIYLRVYKNGTDEY